MFNSEQFLTSDEHKIDIQFLKLTFIERHARLLPIQHSSISKFAVIDLLCLLSIILSLYRYIHVSYSYRGELSQFRSVSSYDHQILTIAATKHHKDNLPEKFK